MYNISKIHQSLPIFMISGSMYSILYAPGKGIKIRNDERQEIIDLFLKENFSFLKKDLFFLYQNAEKAAKSFKESEDQLFKPECLTVYISNDCNLNCQYCYSRANYKEDLTSIINIEAVLIAANHVALNCINSNNPFVLVMHGGGEPTFHWEIFIEIFMKVKEVSERAGVKLFSYVATNGMIEKGKAEWLANNFSLVGLSCDGPAFINSKQRKGANEDNLKETARIVVNAGGQIDIRTTITKDTMGKQLQIADYLITELNAQRIRFEPEYQNTKNPFKEEDAFVFLTNYLKALDYAKGKHVELSYSGIRINELHHTYCDLNRNTIRINPQNEIINCFCDTNNYRFPFGRIDFNSKELVFQDIQKMKREIFNLPIKCKDCINIYHCSRGCPDYCVLSENDALNNFKCALNIQLAVELIKRNACLISDF